MSSNRQLHKDFIVYGIKCVHWEIESDWIENKTTQAEFIDQTTLDVKAH